MSLPSAAQSSPLQQPPAVLQSTSAMYPASPPHRLPPARKSHEVLPSFIRSLEIYARYSIAHCVPLIPRNRKRQMQPIGAGGRSKQRSSGELTSSRNYNSEETAGSQAWTTNRRLLLLRGLQRPNSNGDPCLLPPRTPHTTRIVGALHMSISPPPVDQAAP